MTTDEISGKPRVPVGELKALYWKVNDVAEYMDGMGHSGVASSKARECADELEALIERYDYE